MPTIKSLYFYPVKSCHGISLERARLTETGIEHDRDWMVVSAAGRFLTQRELPGLARIVPAFEDGTLVLDTPGAGRLRVPVDLPGAPREVTVWGDRCVGIDQGEEAAQWFSAALARELRLLRFDAGQPRRIDPDWTGAVEAHTTFTDGYSLLAISQASLDDLNSRLPVALPMDRFRPNLVLEGLEAYGEDRLSDLVGDGVRLRVVKPCTRCAITTTDQETGVVQGEEPLRTLKTYRWDSKLRGVAFGQNLIIVEGAGRELRVGQVLSA